MCPQLHLDERWREYDTFERELSEVLSQALIAEHFPRMQHARQVHLERLQYSISLNTSYGNTASRILEIPPENTTHEQQLLSK